MTRDTVLPLFDLDQHGGNNCSGVLANPTMGKLLEDNSFNLPEGKPLNEAEEKNTPFYLLDDKFFFL